jgi:catechol 2,3-dioxygenase-like lactoylglutathione lyase family enzyme
MAVQQAVAVKSFDHAVLPVTDLWRAECFFAGVLGGGVFQKVGLTLDEVGGRGGAPPGAFIKVGRQHLGLFLQNRTPVHAPPVLDEGAPCWGIGVAAEDLASIVERVRAAGVAVEVEDTARLGGPPARSVRCLDTEGNCLELRADERGRYNGQSLTGLTHMDFEALDLAATSEFYQRFLGLQAIEQDADRLTLGMASGQQWIFHRVSALSPAMVGPYRGRHFAFHVDDATFHAIVERLRAAGVEEGDVRGSEAGGQAHQAEREGSELGTYFNDPNGIRLQLINHDSAQAVEGRTLVRYTAA